MIGKRPLTAFTAIADLDNAMVAERMASDETCVVRCETPEDLPGALRRIAARNGITRLDILDHGAEGTQTLGNGTLFASDRSPSTELVGVDIAKQIAPYLAETAQIRLLGCNTGERKAGRMLLLKLARALGGHRIVFGTIDRVIEQDFDRNGYAQVMEHQRLFSSIAALDTEAPGAMQRFENMRRVKAAII